MSNEYRTSYLQKGSGSDVLADIFEAMPMVRVFGKGAVIYSQDDDPDCFYYLKSGRVRIYMSDKNGSEKTVSVAEAGAVLGEASFFDGLPRMSCASALTRCETVSVNKNVLTDIIRRSPAAAFEIFRLQAQTIRLLSAQVDSASFGSAKKRLACLLLDCCRRDGTATVKMTHEEIASFIGVSRITVSRLIGELAAEGTVSCGYREIRVENTERLTYHSL